jgi:hypothetical protein
MMRNKIIKRLLTLVILSSVIKLFLIILVPRGDASVFLGIKFNPLQKNVIYQYDTKIDGEYLIIMTDEIQLMGEPILLIFFSIPLLVYVFLIVILVFLLIVKSKNK